SNIITLHFQDGARGDSDLTVNGSIVDPSAVATKVNHPPTGADRTITINEDTPYMFTGPDFGFSELIDSPVNRFQAGMLTTVSAAGTLTLDGTPVHAGDEITIPPAGTSWTARESNRQWVAVASSAYGSRLIAAAAHGGLYISADAGVNWRAVEINRNWS